jgi:sugar lactone lactonase YvrE
MQQQQSPHSDPEIETVATTTLSAERCHLGEGATYDPASDTAWWFDILERRLFEADLGGAIKIHALPVMASALAMVDDQTQLLATEGGLFLRGIGDGQLVLHTAIEADNPLTRSNDSRAHPCGTFWTSTMGRNAELGAGGIYALHDGVLHRLFANITIPNAICFSEDGATGYFTDTRERVLCRVALDPATGLPTGAPSSLYVHRGKGGMDGAVVDSEGLIWCARWGAGCVDAYTPEGVRVRTLRVPARQPSCPVFVGHRFDRMLMTSAHEGMDETARAADPDHGRTFILDPGARGRPEPRVRIGTR